MFKDPVTVDMDAVRTEARRRQQSHDHDTTKRFFANHDHENILGVAGEFAFQEWSGLPPNPSQVPDGGRDFSFILRERELILDVKTARVPHYLLLKEADVPKKTDLYILAQFDEPRVWLLGWEHKGLMLLMPKRDMGRGIISHARLRSEIRPMWQLRNQLELSRNYPADPPRQSARLPLNAGA